MDGTVASLTCIARTPPKQCLSLTPTSFSNSKNSIRHNLSQEPCFVKLDRDSTEKGKGGYWALNPQFRDFDYIANKRRRKFKNRNANVPLNGRRKKTASSCSASDKHAQGRLSAVSAGRRVDSPASAKVRLEFHEGGLQ